jgi:hypothetical protein
MPDTPLLTRRTLRTRTRGVREMSITTRRGVCVSVRVCVSGLVMEIDKGLMGVCERMTLRDSRSRESLEIRGVR